MADFRERIKKEAERRPISISEIARRAGMPRSQLGNLLRKENPNPKSPTIETLKRIAGALGWSVGDLVDDKGKARPHNCAKELGLQDFWPISKKELGIITAARKLKGAGFDKAKLAKLGAVLDIIAGDKAG